MCTIVRSALRKSISSDNVHQHNYKKSISSDNVHKHNYKDDEKCINEDRIEVHGQCILK